MGLVYLDGYSWAQISREERFFCAHLFQLIQTDGVKKFIQYLNFRHKTSLDEQSNWELAYEACFYRDLWQHRRRKGTLFSPKRTFDLCLLSDNSIVVIEAKAHQEFETNQLSIFEKDKSQIRKETSVDTVLLTGLASSKYKVPQKVLSYFNGSYLTWHELANLYNNDAILRRADDIYESGSYLTYGKNNVSGYMKGNELATAHANGEEFMVGRKGGLTGKAIIEDVSSGAWKTQKYETNREATEIKQNWFWLSEFMLLIRNPIPWQINSGDAKKPHP